MFSPVIVIVALITAGVGVLGARLLAAPAPWAVGVAVVLLLALVGGLHWSVLYGMERILDGTENASVQALAVPASAYFVMLFSGTMYLLPGFVAGLLVRDGTSVLLLVVGIAVVAYSVWVIPFSVFFAWRRAA
jgi:hypothetical protein